MEKRAMNSSGLLLIGIGALALLHTFVLPALGWEFGLWRLWPLLVGAIGLGFVLVPFAFQPRGLKALFIPGLPLLMVSALMLWSSIFNSWGIWGYLWPMVILALAFGFFLAALFMRNIWLLIPAIIIGMNGLVFQFCAVTGWWEAWSILWTIEPLAVGVALLVASGGQRRGLMRAGTILVAVAGLAFALMSMLLSGWVSVLGSAVLILVGAGLLLRGRVPMLLREKTPQEKLADPAL